MVAPPVKRQMRPPRQAGDDYQEPLQPHPHIHQHRGEEHPPRAPTHALEQPHRDRDEERRQQEQQEQPPVRPLEHLQLPQRQIRRLQRVQREDPLHHEEEEPRHRYHDEQPPYRVEVVRANVLVHLPHPHYQRHYHRHRRHARMDRPDDEIRREYRGMPALYPNRHREVPRHDAVNRHEHRQHQRRQQDPRYRLQPPLPRRPAPAQAQECVDLRRVLPRRPIPHYRQVRDQRHEHEQRTPYQIGHHRARIPHKRRPHIHEDVPRKVIRIHPKQPPRPPHMEHYVGQRGHQREQRHHLGRPRNRPPPLRLRQAQDRRNHYPRVAYPYPKHEVRDVKAPQHRPTQPRHANALVYLIPIRAQPRADHQQQKANRPKPPLRRSENALQQIPIHFPLRLLDMFLHL